MFVRNSVFGGLLVMGLVACGGGGSGSNAPPPVQQPPPPPPPANRAPEVAIITPITGNSFTDGDMVTFEGSALDPEEGALDGARLVWTMGSTELATGRSFTTGTLVVGTHTIRLTATDTQGLTSTSSVSIRVSAPAPAPTPRAGETHPYAGKIQRTPVKRDDEVVLVGRSITQDRMILGVVDRPVATYFNVPGDAPVPPRILERRDDAIPVAGDAGHLLRSNHEQAAIVRRTSGTANFRLDIVGLEETGTPIIASTSVVPPLPEGAVEVLVADLDAFDETGGVRAINGPTDRAPEYHDEVAVAHLEIAGSELRARIHVFSFEDVEAPEELTDPTPAPTSALTVMTTSAMLPGSRLILRHGDSLFGGGDGPHLVVAYLNPSRQVVIDAFRYQHSRVDPKIPNPRTDTRTLTHTFNYVFPGPIDAQAAAAGGWDLVLVRGEQFGTDEHATFDFVFVLAHEAGELRQELWRLENDDGVFAPNMIQGSSHAFGNIHNLTVEGQPVSILPNSRLRAVVGRIAITEEGSSGIRCEAMGLQVLADTTRGPAVQALMSYISEFQDMEIRFGPVGRFVAWNDPAFAAADTTQITQASLVAGGFVSSRRALIGERSAVFESPEIARDCDYANTKPLLGPMPSFYVVQPERSLLHAVTLPLGLADGGGTTVSTSIDPAFESVPILLAADINGDAAYYDSRRCLVQNQFESRECHQIFLGDAELHYVLENIETSNVILQQPPKHIDYLPALGGLVDVSMREDFFAEFSQTDTKSGSINRKTKTDWSIGERVKVGIGSPESKNATFSSSLDLSLDLEHQTVQEIFIANENSVSLTQTTGAVDDDVVWAKIQTTDFWRFPAQGGRQEGNAAAGGLAEDAYMDIAIPGEPMTMIGPGALNDNYQPTHQPGNILSYPAIAGSVQDIGELFGMLGSFETTDAQGAKECAPLQTGLDTDVNGCLIKVTDELERVFQVYPTDEFVAGQFRTLSEPIDVAEILQVGGISYQAELEFNETVKRGETVTNTDTLKGEFNAKVEGKGKKLTGSIEAQLRASAAFENSTISENTLGSKTRIALHMPSNIPAQRSYRIRPSFGFTVGGGLQVSYQVGTDGAAASFWQQHYSKPDAALNLPHRIVRTGDGFELNTDFSRNRMKGLFIRDGAGIDPLDPSEKVGRALSAAPRAGEPVQLEARVYNLSVGTPLSDVVVRFSAQEYQNGTLVGQPTKLGDATIEFIPYRGQFADVANGHIASAYLIWDTTAFGPETGQTLKEYLILVTVDPDNLIPDETHELEDRHDNPLRGPGDVIVDDGIERGQNNRGWSTVRVAPSLAAPAPSGSGQFALKARLGGTPHGDRATPVSMSLRRQAPLSPNAPLQGQIGQALTVRVNLQAETLSRDYGLLQIFEGDPDNGGRLFATRRVHGLSADGATTEEFSWRPARAGDQVLYARYFGSGVHPILLQIPTRIRK
jgi:hypothetical protein